MTRFPFPRLCLARQPEIEHFDGPVVAHLDVRGLQVAVDHSGFVCGLQCLGDLCRDRQRLIDRNRPFRDAIRQRRPVRQFQTSALTPSDSFRP